MSLAGPGTVSFDRRRLFTVLAAGAVLPSCMLIAPSADARQWSGRIAALETDTATRIGACVLNLADGSGFGWRMDERFAMCSSFKLSLAAMVLREGAAGRIGPAERIAYSEADLLSVSPVTRANLGKGLTLAELAEATQTTSDNAAANLLLRRLGGPAALTRFWRNLGDRESRLDRLEPELNRVAPGDLRDTTTPRAMARTLRALFAGDALPPAERTRLSGWMAATQTGLRRIRAGLPQGWQAGDKTGTATFADQPSHYIDLAIATSPAGKRLAITGFVTTTLPQQGIDPAMEEKLAEIGRIAAAWSDRG